MQIVVNAARRIPAQTNEHRWQRATVRRLYEAGYTPILAGAAKEDPACLSDFGATNLDIQTFDPSTGIDLVKQVPNFVHGSILEMPFPDASFRLVVLTEVMEHLRPHRALQALKEARRVMSPDGRLVISFPIDPRPIESQHSPPVYTEFVEGCFASHVEQWTDDRWLPMIAEVGLCEEKRDYLTYVLGGVVLGGRGLVLKRREHTASDPSATHS